MIRRVVLAKGLFKIHNPITRSRLKKAEEPQVVEQELLPQEPVAPQEQAIRQVDPSPDTPQAWCAHCSQWRAMRWLPKDMRGKRAEEWFECAECGCRGLTLHYLSPADAVAKNMRAKEQKMSSGAPK